MSEILFHEAPMTGRFTLLALAYGLDGRFPEAREAIDRAYLLKMVMTGRVLCDRNRDFEAVPNRFTTGLASELLRDVGGRVCMPFFNLGTWEEKPRATFDTPYIGGVEYERVRHVIGFGRSFRPVR